MEIYKKKSPNHLKMELPFASFLLRFLLLTLLSIIANVTYTTAAKQKPIPQNLFSKACVETKHPYECFVMLNFYSSTREASSLHELGVGSLEVAMIKSETSITSLNYSLIHIVKDHSMRQKYEGCRDKYKSAIGKLIEAKARVVDKKYAAGRNDLEQVSSVPSTCRKELGQQLALGLRLAIATSDLIFEAALVVVGELEVKKKLLHG